MRKYFLIVVLLASFLLSIMAFGGFYISRNIKDMNRGAIFAEVISMPAGSDSCQAITVEYLDEVLVLENKWKPEDLGDFTPADTVEVGKNYMFYIERIPTPANSSDNKKVDPSQDRNSLNYFKVYNLVGDKLLPLSESRLDKDFINLILNGNREMELKGMVK